MNFLCKKAFLFFSAIMLVFGCSKDEDEVISSSDEPDTVEFKITSVVPNEGEIGDEIKVSWQGKEVLNENISLRLNDLDLEIIDKNNDNLWFRVPDNATTGKIQLEIDNSITTTSEDFVVLEPDTPNGVTHEPIYYFKSGRLRSINLNNDGGLTFATASSVEFTPEIYNIGYDNSDQTFFGFTDYYNSMKYESINIETNQRTIKSLCDCQYKSVTVNTRTNTKILIKYGETYDKVIFEEFDEQEGVTFESPEIDLGEQVSEFIYISSIDAYVSLYYIYSRAKLFVINANTYELTIFETEAENPSTNGIGYSLNYTNLLHDSVNDVLYAVRENGVYQINFDGTSFSITKIETNWETFFSSYFSGIQEISTPLTIYYPPTNEIIIQGTGFYGYSSGNNKFFAVSLDTMQLREIETDFHTFYRVYGLSMIN